MFSGDGTHDSMSVLTLTIVSELLRLVFELLSLPVWNDEKKVNGLSRT